MNAEEVALVLCDALSEIEAAFFNAKKELLKLTNPEKKDSPQPTQFPDDIFERLNFRKEIGKNNFGEYEKATLENNDLAVFNKAKAILLQKKATIDKKTRLKHAGFGYWAYFKTANAIYRQKTTTSY